MASPGGGIPALLTNGGPWLDWSFNGLALVKSGLSICPTGISPSPERLKAAHSANSQWGDRKGGPPRKPAGEKPGEVGALAFTERCGGSAGCARHPVAARQRPQASLLETYKY